MPRMQLAAARNGAHRARIVLFARLKSRVNVHYFQIPKDLVRADLLLANSSHLSELKVDLVTLIFFKKPNFVLDFCFRGGGTLLSV